MKVRGQHGVIMVAVINTSQSVMDDCVLIINDTQTITTSPDFLFCYHSSVASMLALCSVPALEEGLAAHIIIPLLSFVFL